MKTTLKGTNLIVNREDQTFPTESAWWYALKVHLNANGHDLIKRVMSKDGHLMGSDTYPYYLRDRKSAYCFYDGDYALRDIRDPKVVYLIYQSWRLK